MENDEIEKDLSETKPGPPVDFYLQYFSYLANVVGLGMGITVSVKGQLISGTTVSHNQYLELLRSQFKDANSAFEKETADLIDRIINPLFAQLDDETEIEPLEFDEIKYLHLRDVSVLQDGKQVNIVGPIMRIRLDAVDGFFIGSAGETV